MRKIEVGKNRYIVAFHCDYCGTEQYTSWSHYSRRKRHFCDQDCYVDFCRWCLPKEEHNRYGCGHTLAERLIRKKCRYSLNHAIKQGKIKRQLCRVCDKPAEAHHPDYTKPFLVEWLCFLHHRKEHKHLKQMEAKTK